MPLFLIDPPMGFYYLLIVLALSGLAVFYRNQTRRSLITALVATAPLLALTIIDYSAESPREEAVRKIGEIARGTQQHKLDDAFRNVSDDFQYHGYTKAAIRQRANAAYDGAGTGLTWNGVVAWDFAREEFKQVTETQTSQGFLVKMGDGGPPLYCKVHLKKEGDGQYRVIGFSLHDPAKRDNDAEMTLPDCSDVADALRSPHLDAFS